MAIRLALIFEFSFGRQASLWGRADPRFHSSERKYVAVLTDLFDSCSLYSLAYAPVILSRKADRVRKEKGVKSEDDSRVVAVSDVNENGCVHEWIYSIQPLSEELCPLAWITFWFTGSSDLSRSFSMNPSSRSWPYTSHLRSASTTSSLRPFPVSSWASTKRMSV